MHTNPLNRWLRFGGMSLVLILTTFAFLLTRAEHASALSTTTVTQTAIANDPADGGCDLYEALQAIADVRNGSNSDGDGDLSHYHECGAGPAPHFVIFGGAAVGGVIKLPTTLNGNPFPYLPFVTDDVTITGPAVIDGGGSAVNGHIFWTSAGGSLTLVNLVVQNGYTTGGGGAIIGLSGDDVINIIGCSFMNNTAEGNGGAIDTAGQINIMLSNFSGNKALGLDLNGNDYPGQGGAIHQTGYNNLTISLSNFAGNIATEGGGAIYTRADTGNISDTVFNGNIVNDDAPVEFYSQGGAAINNGGNNSDSGILITRSAFNGNLSFNAPGGAIFNAPDGYMHIYDSSFNANIAGTLFYAEHGGAIYNQEVLDIQRVMFLANVAASGVSINDEEYGNGGAIANDRTGIASFANVSFTANGAPGGHGGAIWNGNTQQGGPASYVYLYNDTFSLNTSLSNDGAAIYNQSDGSHEVYVANTIVDGIGIGGNNCNEALTSQGHNIDSANTCGFNQPGDQHDTGPGIKTLDFNGGPLTSLLSHGLNPDSPAIDAGDPSVCANDYVHNLDQRSDPRPKGGACDIGAFESDVQVAGFGSLPIPPGPVVIGNTSVGSPLVNSFLVIDAGNVELSLSNGHIIGGDSDQFELITSSVSTSDTAEIYVRCLATAEGEFTSTLGFTTNVPNLPAVAYILTCNVGPAATPGYGSDPIAPGTLEFGQVEVGNGDTSLQNLTYFEVGNATLTIGGAELTGANPTDFTFNAFDTTINNGEPEATLPITCTPQDYGIRTATLTLTTNDPTQPTVEYTLVCEGIAPPSPELAAPGGLNLPGLDNPDLNETYDVAVSPDGQYVYVTNYVSNKIVVYKRDAVTGNLSFVMDYQNNVDMVGPAMIEVSPDGTQVYVTAIDSDAFLIFNRSSTYGFVTLDHVFKNSAPTPGLDYAFGLTVSPDGRNIYVTGFYSNALVTFYRDADGYVGYDSTFVDNTHLAYPYIPVISPDGKHIYVSGGGTSGFPDYGYVSVFARDAFDGSISFVQQLEQSDPSCFFNCIWGLEQAWGITVSPDGKNVYVTGFYDDSIVRFNRNAFDGMLTYGDYQSNSLLEDPTTPVTKTGTLTSSQTVSQTALLSETLQTLSPLTPGGIEAIYATGLDGAVDVKVSPDGRYVYVTGFYSDAVAVFGRNLSNGYLTQIQTILDDGSLNLNGAREIGLSPDGSSVYVTSYADGALQLFEIANPIPTLSSLLPASVQAGSGGFTLEVMGENFMPTSIARINGVDRPTTFIHPGKIEVTVMGTDVGGAGNVTITVVNPAPGGGLSLNTLTLTVTASGQNPIPSIASLTPTGTEAGGTDLTVTLYGYNFLSNSTVTWNGNSRAKTFVNSTTLQITVTSTDLLTPGPVVITVSNPGPGGGTSNTVTFDIADPGENPVPTIHTLSSWDAIARGAFARQNEIHVYGEHFVSGVQAQWNGQNRPTKFVSETEIVITLTAYDMAFAGSGAITVINPGPGGGTSNALTFTVYPYGIGLPAIVR
ncbi:MAG: beta-propeller fold lactonase family protein [Anaerolineales bacterium]|nr:beta-propeller fold lactonase family protein [Anaerolineales bacterium]